MHRPVLIGNNDLAPWLVDGRIHWLKTWAIPDYPLGARVGDNGLPIHAKISRACSFCQHLGSTSRINSIYLRVLLVLDAKVNADRCTGNANGGAEKTDQGTNKAAN